MTAIPTPRNSAVHPVSPLFLWVFIQVLALLACAGRMPLYAHQGFATDRYATEMIAVAQITVGVIGAEYFFSNPWTSAMVLLTALPMLQLAAVMNDRPFDRSLLGGTYVVLFLYGVSAWCAGLKHRRIALMVIWLVVLGGPVALYLSREFGDGGEMLATLLHFTPLLAVIDLLSGKNGGIAWGITFVFAAGGAALWFLSRRSPRI